MEEIFHLLIQLEEDIAGFYAKANTLTHNPDLKDIYRLMNRESSEHAHQIEAMENPSARPILKKDAVFKVQELIKDRLLKKLSESPDVSGILKEMAEAEKQTGLLYKSVAEYYRNLADYYIKIAESVEKVSEHEMAHKRIIEDFYMKRAAEKLKGSD